MNSGITDSNEQQAEIRKLAIKDSNRTYLVIDHTKFNKTSFAYIGEFKEINTVVTNKPLSDEWYQMFQNIGVEVIQPENLKKD